VESATGDGILATPARNAESNIGFYTINVRNMHIGMSYPPYLAMARMQLFRYKLTIVAGADGHYIIIIGDPTRSTIFTQFKQRSRWRLQHA
jgi:hypothetical protein